jgi:hypothetical protein
VKRLRPCSSRRAAALRVSRRVRRDVTTVHPASNGSASVPCRAGKNGADRPFWRRLQGWTMVSVAVVGGRANRTDFRVPCGAGVVREEALRRIPVRVDGIDEETDGVEEEEAGHPARRQATRDALMDAYSSEAGSSREGRPQITLRRRGATAATTGAAGARGHAVAQALGSADDCADGETSPSRVGLKFGGREARGGGRWWLKGGLELGGAALPEKRGGGRPRRARASQERLMVILRNSPPKKYAIVK